MKFLGERRAGLIVAAYPHPGPSPGQGARGVWLRPSRCFYD